MVKLKYVNFLQKICYRALLTSAATEKELVDNNLLTPSHDFALRMRDNIQA